jgi:hypothetical protein
MKLVVLLPLTLPYISTGLIRFGQAILGFLSPSVQVVFVMMVFPLVMNVIQFCIVDQVIKSRNDEEEYRPLPTEAVPKTSTPVMPRSPLLEAADSRDYGSTSPRPSIRTSLSNSRDDWRSDAPSPDSIARLDESRFGHVSRLSSDMGTEARRSLSPRDNTASFASALEVMGMEQRR